MAKGAAKAKAKARATVRPKARAKAAVKAKAKAKSKAGALPGRTLPRSAGAVAPSSGLVGQGRIFKDGSVTYDADLNLSDSAQNTNKFYRMQVVESNDCSKYWFVQHWGRIGTSGQTQVKGPFGKDVAAKALRSKFRQKAGVAFENRGAAAPGSSSVTGKYEITQRLKAAGAKFSKAKGSVAISLMWNNTNTQANDLDLHVTPPSGETIWYNHKQSKCHGVLDVDRMQNSRSPVENVVWTKNAPKGTYKISVKNFSADHSNAVPFQVGIVIDGGEMKLLNKTMPCKIGAIVPVKRFKYL